MLFRPLLRARRAAAAPRWGPRATTGSTIRPTPGPGPAARPRRAALDLGRCPPPSPAADDPAAAALCTRRRHRPGSRRDRLRPRGARHGAASFGAEGSRRGDAFRRRRRASAPPSLGCRPPRAAGGWRGRSPPRWPCAARLAAQARRVLVARDAGEMARGRLQPMALGRGGAGVWDGRFSVGPTDTDLTVTALKGQSARLSAAERRALAGAPAAARPALPVLVEGQERPTCPILAGRDGVERRVRSRAIGSWRLAARSPASRPRGRP